MISEKSAIKIKNVKKIKIKKLLKFFSIFFDQRSFLHALFEDQLESVEMEFLA